MTPAPTDPLACRLARFLHSYAKRPLLQAQRQALTIRLIDAFACAAMARAALSEAGEALPVNLLADARCNIIGGGAASTDEAAFVYGYMIRKLDWNDTYIGQNGGHPSDLIGAVLAAGLAKGRSGSQMLKAIGAGTHVMLDLCDAASAISRGWDPSTYIGLSATAALCVLEDLDEERTAHALAMTAVSGNMLLARTGRISMWKSLASAIAARNSLFHVELAQRGLPGPDPSFSGEFGFAERISGPLEPELDIDRDRSADSHLKFYPAVYHAQGPIEAALDLHGRIAGQRIDSASVAIYPFAIRYTADDPAKWAPKTVETATHSLPFIVAHVLLRGEFSEAGLRQSLQDADVLALAQKIEVKGEETFGARWPDATPSRIVLSAGGKTYEKSIEHIIGHDRRPLGLKEVEAKFRMTAAPYCGQDKAEAWLRRIARFPDLVTADDCAEAMSPLM